MSSAVSTARNQPHGPAENLLYVFVVSRHGPRTAVIPCKKLLKKEPVDHGQLAEKGRERTFKLGQFRRDRYRLFLEGSTEKPGQVLATYVDLDRCRDSVKETLRGLGGAVAATNADPTMYDVPFLDSVKANLDKALKEPGRDSYATLGDLIAFVTEKTVAPRNNNEEKFLVIDSLVTYVFSGNPVPDWAKPTWDDFLWTDQMVFVRTPSVRSLAAYVLDTLTVPFEKRPDKMNLFSMSDTSGFSVLRLLDSSHASRPCFCASILIEVYSRDGTKDFVRVLYRTKHEPCLVPMEKMGNPCELTEFLEFLRSVPKTREHKK
nr:uncharacterized protein LOC119179395 [Rhipicephalus microplus]